MSQSLLVFLANGFEEIEVVVPVDLWRRGGIEVVTASITEKKEVTGAHGILLQADALLSELVVEAFDAVYLPGGSGGVEQLLADSRIAPILRQTLQRGALVAAICAAPRLLAEANLLEGRQVTSYPSLRREIEKTVKDFRYSEERVVVDENLVTSRGPGTASELAFELLKMMAGSDRADEVRKGSLF